MISTAMTKCENGARMSMMLADVKNGLPVWRRKEVVVVFQHETRDIFFRVHVDDLLCTGLRADLMWPKKQLLKEYELKTMLVGEDDDMEKGNYLSRTLK